MNAIKNGTAVLLLSGLFFWPVVALFSFLQGLAPHRNGFIPIGSNWFGMCTFLNMAFTTI